MALCACRYSLGSLFLLCGWRGLRSSGWGLVPLCFALLLHDHGRQSGWMQGCGSRSPPCREGEEWGQWTCEQQAPVSCSPTLQLTLCFLKFPGSLTHNVAYTDESRPLEEQFTDSGSGFFFPKPCLSPSAAYFITLLSFIQDIFTHPSIFSFSQLSAAHHPQRWTFIHDPLHQKCKSKQHWNYIFVNQAGRICFFFNINTHCCHVSMKLGIVMYYRQGYKLLKLSRRQWNNFYLRSWRHLCHLTWQFYLGSLCWDLGSVLEMISWVFIIICSLTSEKIELRKGG